MKLYSSRQISEWIRERRKLLVKTEALKELIGDLQTQVSVIEQTVEKLNKRLGAPPLELS
jgi:hypothetical protein